MTQDHSDKDETVQSRAQKHIQALLRTDPQASLAPALKVLAELERRQVTELGANDLDPLHTMAVCCFDRATPASWCAASICQRCASINALLRAPPSSIYKTVLGTALITTDCISADCVSDRDGQQPELPLELVQLIIDFAVAAYASTKDGSALRRLMHVSCLVRAQVCKVFGPLRVYECDPEPDKETRSPFDEKPSVTVRLPRSLTTYLGDTLAFALQDFSVQRYAEPPSLPDFCDVIRTTKGLVATGARVNIKLRCDTFGDEAKAEIKRIEFERCGFSEDSSESDDDDDFGEDAQTESALEVGEMGSAAMDSNAVVAEASTLEDAVAAEDVEDSGEMQLEELGNAQALTIAGATHALETIPGAAEDVPAVWTDPEQGALFEDRWSSDTDSQVSADEVASATPRVISPFYRVLRNQGELGPPTRGVIVKVALLLWLASPDVLDEDREETEVRYDKLWRFDTLQKRSVLGSL